MSDEQGNFKLEDEQEISLNEKFFVKIPIIENSSEETIVEEPVGEEPVEEEPVIEEPVIEEPVAEEPAIVEETISEEPWIQNNVDEEPWIEQQSSEEPVIQKLDEFNPAKSLKTDEFVIDEIKKQSLYLRLLQIFYNNGNKKVSSSLNETSSAANQPIT